MKSFGEPATAAARFQDALDLMKSALGDFKRPIEEAIQTLERVRALAASIESESMLTQMTVNLRDGAALLRRELHRQGAPGAEIAASLFSAERNLREQSRRRENDQAGQRRRNLTSDLPGTTCAGTECAAGAGGGREKSGPTKLWDLKT